jgi:DNA processing protein
MDSTFDLLTLSLLRGVSLRDGRTLLLRQPLADTLARPEEQQELLGEANVRDIRSGAARRAAEEELRRAAALGVRVVGREEPEYPERLRQIFDPPHVLYIQGSLVEGEGGHSVAIVGSRAASPHGVSLARSMARELAGAGLTIVSGLARGIDTAAHQGALDAGGRTVAVLGSALDRLYPVENAALARAIAERGAVVSEFPLGTAPLAANFPRRNRVIAGWGRAVVVVEAAQRSGALVTARCAYDEGRDVMAVPGHPSQDAAAGTNALIRDGAALVRHAADVAQELDIELPTRAAVDADPVLAALSAETPRTLDEVQRQTGRPASEVLGRLAELELASRVRRLPGALFVRA